MTGTVIKLLRATAIAVKLKTVRQAVAVEKSVMAASYICHSNAPVANGRHE